MFTRPCALIKKENFPCYLLKVLAYSSANSLKNEYTARLLHKSDKYPGENCHSLPVG